MLRTLAKTVPVAVLLLPSVAACGGGPNPHTVQACHTFRQAANGYAKQSLGLAAYTTQVGKMQAQALKSTDKKLARDVTHLMAELTRGSMSQAAKAVRTVGRDCNAKGL